MSVRKRIVFLALAGLCFFATALVAAYIADAIAGRNDLVMPAVTSALVARGEYLAKLGDCAACHSVPGRPAFTGGLPMKIPVGTIFTTNITPDPTYGIGRFTLSDFDRALRFGVSKGHTLYPAMPFPSYANTKPEDVAALYAYFKTAVPPQAVKNEDEGLAFPFSMRWPLSYWRLLFSPRPKPYQTPSGTDPSVAQGGYFVEGMGHCGECHTPRGIALQVKAQAAGNADFLSGARVENYYAPSLRTGGPSSIADWSTDEIATFLRSGANHRAISFGSMSEVVSNSTQYMTAEDALAAAKFLKSLRDSTQQAQSPFAYNEATDRAFRAGDAGRPGAMGYLDNCAACHRPDGKGYDAVFPALAGNPVVEASDPISLASIVLNGSLTPKTAAAPAQFAMPSFAWRLSDEQVADVVNFIRSSWGNNASPINVSQVRELRKEMPLQ